MWCHEICGDEGWDMGYRGEGWLALATMSLLSIEDLSISFRTPQGPFSAVDGVSLRVERGQAVGIVGESGCGKSVTCYGALGLLPTPPAKVEGGRVLFEGEDLLGLSEPRMRMVRGQKIAMIFQDPMTSLNPFLKISTQLAEPLIIHESMRKKEALHRAIEALEEVGIEDAARRIGSYPHEFSGGMRQRVMIAMALITRPQLLIADEPTTALDVTVQAQVLEILDRRRKELGTAVIFISHDLAVVGGVCEEVNVMYAGRVVERGPAERLFGDPQHPYTRALRDSQPAAHQPGEELASIGGNPPGPGDKRHGCAFGPRCPSRGEREIPAGRPAWQELGGGHGVEACGACVVGGAASESCAS
jgi:oligopeptide transport system ATP-binding protein